MRGAKVGAWATAAVVLVATFGWWALASASAQSSGLCGSNGTISYSNSTATCTWSAGTSDTFTIPANVTSISVTAVGGAGGSGQGGAGGKGAQVAATFSVTGGNALAIQAAGNGGNGTYNNGGAGGAGGGGGGGYGPQIGSGGGGGGASTVYQSSTAWVVAAGGGGGGVWSSGSPNGGAGGAPTGGDGLGRGTVPNDNCGGYGGTGATTTAVGTGGAPSCDGGNGGQNGNGSSGGAGGTQTGNVETGGGGGGGGLYGGGGGGGGGGGSYATGGGGGGSSYSSDNSAAITADTTGVPLVKISWSVATPSLGTQVNDNATSSAWSGSESPGAKAYDTASFSALTPNVTPTGSVTYNLYSGQGCGGSPLTTQSVSLNQDGTIPASTATSALDAGSYSFQASYSGDGNYSSASATCEPFTVNQLTQTITFPNTAALYGQPDSSPASASSGLPVTYSDVSGQCTAVNNGADLHITGAGSCTATANQGGNTNYAAASPVTQTFAIDKYPVHVDAVAATKTYGQPDPAATGTPRATDFVNGDTPSSSGITGSPACSIQSHSEDVGTYPGAITCAPGTLSAANYTFSAGNAADLTINQASQSITFPGTAVTYGQADFSPASASSGLPVTYSEVSGTCTAVNGNTELHITGAGACTATANQSGTTNYAAASPVTQTFAIKKASQSIHFTSTPPASPRVGGTYRLSASASSHQPVSFSVDRSSTSGACSLSGASVSFTRAGTCVIDANQAGNANYLPAPQMRQVLSVQSAPKAKRKTTIKLRTSVNPAVVGRLVILRARITPVPGGAWIRFLNGGRPIAGCAHVKVGRHGVATCHTRFRKAGRHVIRARYLGNTRFAGSTSRRLTQRVKA